MENRNLNQPYQVHVITFFLATILCVLLGMKIGKDVQKEKESFECQKVMKGE